MQGSEESRETHGERINRTGDCVNVRRCSVVNGKGSKDEDVPYPTICTQHFEYFQRWQESVSCFIPRRFERDKEFSTLIVMLVPFASKAHFVCVFTTHVILLMCNHK